MKCCTSLTDVYLGDSLSVISDSMFNYCPNLSVLVIPSSVTTISRYAFSFLDKNTVLAYDGTRGQWDNISGVGNVPTTVKVTFTAESGVSACSAFFGGFAANG